MEELLCVQKWLMNSADVKMLKQDKPGSRVLLFKGSITEAYKAAEKLAKELERPLIRVHLSAIISKYIGETEKNIATIFKEAEGKNTILFFDEADALFGKRTAVKDAHDKYANQEVSYLLQSFEEYKGLFILAIDTRQTITEKFLSRFGAVVQFSKFKGM